MGIPAWGRKMTDQEIIDYIRENPYCTGREIDRFARLGQYALGGRIKNLAIDGLI